jgi:hypothetical protein
MPALQPVSRRLIAPVQHDSRASSERGQVLAPAALRQQPDGFWVFRRIDHDQVEVAREAPVLKPIVQEEGLAV